jgi:phage regulator Rha-like protein
MTSTNIALSVGGGNGGPLTMSSREIAELLGARHDSVKRTIERLADKGVIDLPPMVEYLDGLGRPAGEYRLVKRDSYIVVAQLSPEFTARLVDRWAELEMGLAKAPVVFDPSDPKVMLAVFDHLQKQVAEKDQIIAVQTEQVKKLERIDAAEGSMCIRDAAKTLGVRPIDLTNLMAARRWIYKRAGNKNWVGYQDKIQAGYLEHADHLYIDDQGRERVSTRCLVTAKGLVKLAELLNEPLH